MNDKIKEAGSGRGLIWAKIAVLEPYGCGRDTMQRWISEGKLPKPTRIGNRLYFYEDELRPIK